MTDSLKKVDSAVQGLESESPKAEKKHARKASTDNGVVDIKTLDPENVKFATEDIQNIGWKINMPTTSGNDKDALKKPLTDPPVKSFEFCVPISENVAGIEFKVTKPKGVTIKDVMDKLSKKYKDKHEEDLPYGETKAYLKGFAYSAQLEKFCAELCDEASLGGGGSSKKSKKKNKGGD